MEEMILSSNVLRVTKILTKTGARFFGDLKEGSRIEITHKITRYGNRYYCVENKETEEKHRTSCGNLSRYLFDCFEIEKQ